MTALLAIAGSALMLPANFTINGQRICFASVTAFSESCGYAGSACWFAMALLLIGGRQ